LRKYEARNMGHDETCVTVTKPGPHFVSTPVIWREESGSSLPHCIYTRLGLSAFRVNSDARLCSFFTKHCTMNAVMTITIIMLTA